MGDVDAETILKTQKLLGKYVKKPGLTEKLLTKPPFRFLHDIIVSVIRDTGFLKGLYNEAELQSENVKERDSKIQFLNKFITGVKTLSGEDLKVRANKIVAGLEVKETNILLQTVAVCIDKNLDSKAYVNQLKVKDKSKTKDAEKTKKSTQSKTSLERNNIKSEEKLKKTSEEKVKKLKEESKGVAKLSDRNRAREGVKGKEKRDKSKDPEKTKGKVKASVAKSDVVKVGSVEKINSPKEFGEGVGKNVKVLEEVDKTIESPKGNIKSPKEDIKSIKEFVKSPKEGVASPNNLDLKETTAESVIKEEIKINQENDRVKSAYKERPKSARPKSGEIKINNANEKELIKNEVELPKNVLVEQASVESKMNNMIQPSQPKESIYTRPKSSLRPPSVRPSSARPGAPRLRPDSALPFKELVPLGKINVIIENFDAVDSKDEEETVVMQTVTEDVQDNIMLEKSLDIPADKGHLVEQILEQIQDAEQLEEHVKGTIDWEQENSRSRDATTKEINQLRSSIQSLTRTANPLGKLMSYLHEDVEAMHAELDSWTNIKRQYLLEIKKQKHVNSSTNRPLFNQLKDLNEQIRKQQEEISAVKFNILRNEEKIRDLISKQLIV